MSNANPSLVPRVVDALYAIAEATSPEDFTVLDGPEFGDDTHWKYILIGWTGQPDTDGVTAELQDAGAGGRLKEVIEVRGQASISSGNSGQKAARDEVYGVVDAFAAGIAEDTSLGKTVTRAVLREHSLQPDVGDGAICTVAFTIRIEGTR